MAHPLEQRIPCPELIGRADVLAALRARVDQLGVAEPHVALIVGEAGVGKSRLAAELAAYAADRGAQVLRCTCLSADRAAPFAPLLALARARLRDLPAGAAAALIAPFARALAPLLPEWAGPDAAAPGPADEARRQQLAALAHCLLPAQRAGTTLLLIEDLHWCDEASLDALQFLLRAAPTSLLVVATLRDEGPPDELAQWRAQLARTRQSSEVALAPLAADEVTAMIGAILGAPHELAAACAATIAPLAEGRPFAVEELLKALVDAGDLSLGAGGWTYTPPARPRLPHSLAGVIQQRVERLPPLARGLIAAAAVLGRTFDLALLQAVAQLDEPALLDAMRALCATGLVVEEVPDQFAFRHALARQSVYDRLLARERRGLHLAAAVAFEQLSAGDPEDRLADLAQHYAQAEQWGKALAYAGWAGERAQRFHAPLAAVQLYTLALEAAQHLGRPAPGRALQLDLAPARIVLARGQAYELAGQFDRSDEDYRRALDLARRSGDDEGAWEAHSQLGTLWSSRDYSLAGAHWQRALACARDLGRPDLVAHSLNQVGNWLLNTARPDQAIDRHQEALAIFERLGDTRGAAQTLDRLGMTSFLRGDGAASLAYYERAVARFTALGDDYGLVASLVMTMSTRAGTAFFDRMVASAEAFPHALADGERALALASRVGWRAGECFALWALGTLLCHYGRYGRAIEVARRGLQIATAIGHTQWQASSHWTLGMIYLDLLAPRMARAELERALALGRAISSGVWVDHATSALAVAALRDHEPAQAAALLDEAARSQLPAAWSGQLALLWARARLALERRDPAAALGLLGQAGLSGAAVAPDRELIRLALARGEALAALGRSDEAIAVLTRLRDLAEGPGARAPLWQIQAAIGAVHHRAGRPDAAQAAYSAAHALIDAIAAELPDAALSAGFVRAAAERIPSRYSPTSRRARAARYDGLTAREVEVATLIAQGRTNREIAEALVLGIRTVETHISNIFAKLRVADRHEVAAWAHAKGLTDP